MVNLYRYIKDGNVCRKLEVTDLLFAEYKCIQEATEFGLWSDCNYFAFITSGKKMWRTIYHDYEAEGGDILFIKKGANLTHQFFGDEFCAIFFFIPDRFIRAFLQKHPTFLATEQKDLTHQDAVLRLEVDQLLSGYRESVTSFFTMDQPPNEQLLTLKFEELLLSLCTTPRHQPITDYFISLCQSEVSHMQRVMEENFAYNLKIKDYAELCGMSLTKFKAIFKEHYSTTPAAWLRGKKLDLAAHRLQHSDVPISHLSLDCGFEDPSHFIRVFKQRYEMTPHQYRQQVQQPA